MSKRNQAGTMAYLDPITFPIEAGTPFIFQATSDKFEVMYDGDETNDAGSNGALHGTFVEMNQTAINAITGIYILSNNMLYSVKDQSNNTIPAYRAYVVYGDLVVDNAPIQSVPGRRYVTMQTSNVQTPTALEETAIETENAKFILNGQLYILRDGKLYNAQGQLVK
jgi:hypothetical protein